MITLHKIVISMICFAFVMIITFWIIGGLIVYKGVTEVNEQGARGVIERIWCGKSTNCKLPAVE